MNCERVILDALAPKPRMLARISSRSALATDFTLLMERVSGFQLDEFRGAIVGRNALSRASHSARAKLFQELKGRYLLDENVPLFAAFLAEWQATLDAQERLLLAYTLFALNDRTVYVISCDWLFPRLREASSELRLGDLITFLRALGRQACPEIAAWTPSTLTRVAQHYLASVRDFGLATGGSRKVSARPSLKAAPIRLLLRALRLAGVPQAEALRHPAFRLLGMAQGEVVDALAELNRLGSLRFRMQADVIELQL